jgi:hypothetical protein
MRSRSVSISVLAALFLLAFAGPARAGAFGSPIQDNVCGEGDVVEDAMSDPNTAFAFTESEGQCERLCRKSGKACRGHVKDVHTCQHRYLNEQLGFAKENCKAITDSPEEERACKEFYSGLAAEERADIRMSREGNVAACDEWTEICLGSCLAP